jgi:hypothetical protein
MSTITNMDAQKLKEEIVNMHKRLELRKLHMGRVRAGKTCGSCESFCHELGLQKHTRGLVESIRW